MSDIKIWTEPRVSLVSRQEFILPTHVNWTSPSNSGEALSEFAGRLCYLSFGEGELDGHKTIQGRTDTDQYFGNILTVGHGSVLEHAVWSILLEGVSRTFTHELLRHRAGYGFSQLSQRFVDEKDVGFVLPPLILELRKYDTSAYESWYSSCEDSLQSYIELSNYIEISSKLSVHKINIQKKRIREAARSVLPGCTETKIVVTGNARAWRNFLEQRGSPGADLEMIRCSKYIATILRQEAPSIFQDIAILSDGVEVTHHKV